MAREGPLSRRQLVRRVPRVAGSQSVLTGKHPLGIPGDNTYSNYQEATRSFWRQTILPLVNRTAKALAGWLSPAFGTSLELRPDLDAIEALSPEREALWARLEKSSFLTANEKRAAVGYGPIDGGEEIKSLDADAAGFPHKANFNPGQPRTPAGEPGGGQWTDGGGGESGPNTDDARVTPVARKFGGFPRAVLDMTVRAFVSKYCKGHINRELPSQFEDVTIQDIIDLAKGGDAAASKCQKLLKERRFRK